MTLHQCLLPIHAVNASTAWKPIPGFEGYEVSDQGDVRSVDRTVTSSIGRVRRFPGKTLKLRDMTGRGYLYAGLWVQGKLTYTRVNRLVLLAFVGPPPTPEHQALHNNDVKDDNRLSNLRWGTGVENASDAFANGCRVRVDRCGKGHEFTPDNTYIRPDNGQRMCNQCRLDRQRSKRGVVHHRGPYKGRSYVN
ncbi:NUMOD4 domain-containing protein [Mycolicibacterium fortuitum]|uniref:NUMOD4 domain-containing protein n=1 Tax=Mycolicibacterium fortuitum TaxID=1766 RepID=UPI0026197A54|nr:NUMOD4 domain-containing protein [Mycolicibacterium fortuitum]